MKRKINAEEILLNGSPISGAANHVYAMYYKTTGSLGANAVAATVNGWDTGNNELYTDSSFDPSTGIFTCQAGQAGYYQVNCMFNFLTSSNNMVGEIEKFTGGSWVRQFYGAFAPDSGAYRPMILNKTIYLAVGEQIRIRVANATGAAALSFVSFAGANTISIHAVI